MTAVLKDLLAPDLSGTVLWQCRRHRIGAARRYWSLEPWHELASLACEDRARRGESAD